MATKSSGKMCVLCGDDCSTSPRVKDSHGNYYHKSCHEQAEQRQQARDAAKGAAKPATASEKSTKPSEDEGGAMAFSTEPLIDPDDSSFDSADDLRLDDSGDSGSLMSIEADSVSEPQRHVPPQPDREAPEEIDPYAIIEVPKKRTKSPPPPMQEVDDGDDSEAFSMLDELADEPMTASSGLPIEAPPTPSAPRMVPGMAPTKTGGGHTSVWHLVVGILSIIFGASGVLLILWSWVAAFSSGKLSGIGGVVPLLLSAMLLNAGIKITRRQQAGVPMIVRWAWIKATLTLLCGGTVLALMGSASSRIAESAGLTDAEVQELGSTGLMAVIGGTMAWYLVWPAFVLIWFKRGKVQAEIEQWE